jgi:hypothetical protein
MIISASPSTANTPRAHIINAAAFGKYVDSHLPDGGCVAVLYLVLTDVTECLRDIGIEEECLSGSCGGEMKSHTRFCHSFAGREYARLYAWGSGPKRQVTIHILARLPMNNERKYI